MTEIPTKSIPRHKPRSEQPRAGVGRRLQITKAQAASVSLGGNGNGRLRKEHLELIVDTSASGLVTLDLQTGDYEVSDGLVRLLGYEVGNLEGIDFRLSSMIHPDDAVRTIAARDEAIMSGQLFERSYRLRRRDGSYIWVMGTARSVLDDHGEPVYLVAVIRDISFSKRIEAELRAGEERYRAMFTAAPLPMWLIDESADRVLEANEAAHKLYGYDTGRMNGLAIEQLIVGPHRQRFQKLRLAHASDGPRSEQMRHRRHNGDVIEVECRLCPMESPSQRAHVVLINDLTERLAARAEIERLASVDPLTQLPNRLMLTRRLEQLLSRRPVGSSIGAVVHINLDSFKAMNETIGHDGADQVLVETSRRLLQLTREQDLVARVAGDEFVVVMQDLARNTSRAASLAESAATRFLEAIRRPYQINGMDFHVTASLGLVEFDITTESADVVLQNAHAAVEQSKSLGRNQVRFFDASLQAVVQRRASLEIDLRQALRSGQFELYYQIQVNQQLETIGAEVLLRWIHPERGMVSPLEFIALAEETGVIIPLGSWVLNRACDRLASWATIPGYQQFRLSVNVSARQFRQPDFVQQLTGALQRSGARADLLTLELTESMLLDHPEDAIDKMNEIRRLGVGFSLDDFGTGYSSLAYLKRLPIDELKIDRTFTRDILTDPNDAVIVRTIIGMAKNLGLKLIVEGVETSEQQALLTRWGCSGFQGYLHGKPVPNSEFKPHGLTVNASDKTCLPG